MQLPVLVTHLILVLWDVAAWTLAFVLFVLARFNGALTDVLGLAPTRSGLEGRN